MVSILSDCLVVIADAVKVASHLLHISDLLKNVFAVYAECIYLTNNVRVKFIELLRSERNQRFFFERDYMVQAVVVDPSEQLESVHSRHLVIDNHQCDAVLLPLHVQRSNGLCNLQPILEKLCVVFKFHLVVENVLKGDLVESRVFVNKDLSFGWNADPYCAWHQLLLFKLILHLVDGIKIRSNFHVEACFAN